MDRDIALRLLNVAACLEYGMNAEECAAEIRLIVERAAVQPTVCQHDLQLPNDTITSTRRGTAECTVCNQVWTIQHMTPTDGAT